MPLRHPFSILKTPELSMLYFLMVSFNSKAYRSVVSKPELVIYCIQKFCRRSNKIDSNTFDKVDAKAIRSVVEAI